MDLFGAPPVTPAAEQAPIGDMIVAQNAALAMPADVVCVGHDDIAARLCAAINAKRMPHGVVFSGVQGIGKYAMALRLARCLLSQKNGQPTQILTSLDDTLDPLTVRRMDNNAHPDFKIITRDYDDKKDRFKDSVSVKSARKVPTFLQRTASEGGWRVVIVDDADTMNRNAQNAILKILEEPPKQTVLILVAHRMGALLPTIKSRVQSFEFKPLGDDVLRTIIDDNVGMHIADDTIDAALQFAEGSASRALDFINNGGADVFRVLMDNAFTAAPDWAARHACADTYGKASAAQDYAIFVRLMLWTADVCVRQKARAATSLPPIFAPCMAFYDKNDIKALVAVYDKLREHFAMVDIRNLDNHHGVLGAFSITDG